MDMLHLLVEMLYLQYIDKLTGLQDRYLISSSILINIYYKILII